MPCNIRFKTASSTLHGALKRAHPRKDGTVAVGTVTWEAARPFAAPIRARASRAAAIEGARSERGGRGRRGPVGAARPAYLACLSTISLAFLSKVARSDANSCAISGSSGWSTFGDLSSSWSVV